MNKGKLTGLFLLPRDSGRTSKDYELVQTYLGMEKPFVVETAFSTKLLDPAIKMDASRVKK